MGNSLSDHNLSKVQSNIEKGNVHLDSYPYQVHFLMIDKCNVKCIMCGGDYFKSKSGRMRGIRNIPQPKRPLCLFLFISLLMNSWPISH